MIAVILVAVGPAQANLSEDFEDVPPPGWTVDNQSDPLGVTGWFQGNTGVFPAHQGATNSYAGANFNNTGSVGTISNWLVTPMQTTLSSGDVYSFFTRTSAGSPNPDRLELRMASNGSCSPGTGAASVGDFTTLLAVVNPDLAAGAYPETWTNITGTISGLPPGNSSGCLAFRYFVEGVSFNGNGDYIGIDTFTLTDVQPPSALTITGTNPLSPAADASPRVEGVGAQPGAAVNVYATTNCSGGPIGIGSGADFNGAGIVVNVPLRATTQFSADQTVGVARSVCSNTISYTEASPEPTPPTTAACQRATTALTRVAGRLRAARRSLRKLRRQNAARPRVRRATRQVRRLNRQTNQRKRARRAACG